MVLYNAGKAARHSASIANNTEIYGIIGGLAPLQGTPMAHRSIVQMRAQSKQVIPLAPGPGLVFMTKNNLLSKNPANSGGVGRRVLMRFR